MADTGEDDSIAMDTIRIDGPVRYTAERDQVAPGAVVHFVTDGLETVVYAQSEAHAAALVEVMTLVELEFSGSTGWLGWVRRLVLRVVAWVNAADKRSRKT
jgi:hypothetical protein